MQLLSSQDQGVGQLHRMWGLLGRPAYSVAGLKNPGKLGEKGIALLRLLALLRRATLVGKLE